MNYAVAYAGWRVRYWFTAGKQVRPHPYIFGHTGQPYHQSLPEVAVKLTEWRAELERIAPAMAEIGLTAEAATRAFRAFGAVFVDDEQQAA